MIWFGVKRRYGIWRIFIQIICGSYRRPSGFIQFLWFWFLILMSRVSLLNAGCCLSYHSCRFPSAVFHYVQRRKCESYSLAALYCFTNVASSYSRLTYLIFKRLEGKNSIPKQRWKIPEGAKAREKNKIMWRSE